MLMLRRDQPSLWDSVLPEGALALSEELARVDALLDDDRFFASFRERFYTRIGRPTVAVATYLRMMYLKRRYGLGYESLVKEVKDSFSWRLGSDSSALFSVLLPRDKKVPFLPRSSTPRLQA